MFERLKGLRDGASCVYGSTNTTNTTNTTKKICSVLADFKNKFFDAELYWSNDKYNTPNKTAQPRNKGWSSTNSESYMGTRTVRPGLSDMERNTSVRMGISTLQSLVQICTHSTHCARPGHGARKMDFAQPSLSRCRTGGQDGTERKPGERA